MVHLRTGILLCMAAGAVGRGKGSSGGGGAVVDLGVMAYSYGTDWWAEHKSDKSTTEPEVATTDGTYVFPSPPSTAPYKPTTMPSAVSAATSASSPTGPTPTGGVDLTSLFGTNERPDIFHLEAVNVTGLTDENHDTLRAASAVLLALAKSTPDGKWIKSMFDLPGQKGSVYEGPDVVNVTLADGQKNAKSMRMEKGNLERLNKLGVTNDQIKEPWWPWALIEGALEAGGIQVEGDKEAMIKHANLLKCFTGRQTAHDVVETSGESPMDGRWVDKTEAADYSPLVVQLDDKSWGFLMKAPYEDPQGVETIEWAGPWSTKNNDHKDKKKFNTIVAATDIKFQAFVWLSDFKEAGGFEKRPDELAI